MMISVPSEPLVIERRKIECRSSDGTKRCDEQDFYIQHSAAGQRL